MPCDGRTVTFLMADDDAEDCLFFQQALAQAGVDGSVRFVHNGEELLNELRGVGKRPGEPQLRPGLILLDLNMPRKDGRETLQEIKADSTLRSIPVVVLTTSTHPDDVEFAYRIGASSFVTKPGTFRQWVDLARNLSRYWLEVVELPTR